MAATAQMLRLTAWRHLMLLVVGVVHSPQALSHYVDTTGETPAWTIQSLNPELDKLTFPDPTLDNHQPYVAQPDVVYPSPEWTFEVYTESDSTNSPVATSVSAHIKPKRQNVSGIQKLKRPVSLQAKIVSKHRKTSDHSWSVEEPLQKQTASVGHRQRPSGSAPAPWTHGFPLLHGVTTPTKNYVKPLPVDFNFHYSFEDPSYSGPREVNPFAPYVIHGQKNIQDHGTVKNVHSNKAIDTISPHEVISDTSAMSKHETRGYKTPQSFAEKQINKFPAQGINSKQLSPFQIKLQGLTAAAGRPAADGKRKRDVALKPVSQQAVPPRNKLPWTSHDNLPQRIRKDHANSGLPVGYEGSQVLARSDSHSPHIAALHRDDSSMFLPPIIDILVDEADYDYITSLTDGHKASFNFAQEHHLHEPPLAYHSEQIFGGFKGESTTPLKDAPIDFGYNLNAGHETNLKGGFAHYDSSTLDLDYNVQYDFGIAQTQAFKGDAAVVNPGLGFTGHSSDSFGHLGSSHVGPSSGSYGSGGEFHSSGHTQSAFGSGYGKDGHKVTSGDSGVKFQSFDSGYNFDVGHGIDLKLSSKDEIVHSLGHSYDSESGFFHQGGDHALDSGSIVYFDEEYSLGGGETHFSGGTKFEPSKTSSLGHGGAFAYSGGFDSGSKNKFTRSKGSTFHSEDKFIDAVRPSFDSADMFSHTEESALSSEGKFQHSGHNFGSGDKFMQSEKPSFISGSQFVHSGGPSLSTKDEVYQIEHHGFGTMDKIHPSSSSKFKGTPSLSYALQEGHDFTNVFSMFRPVGHDFGPPDVHFKLASVEAHKHHSDLPLVDSASGKFTSKLEHTDKRPPAAIPHPDRRKPADSFPQVQDVGKRSVMSSGGHKQPSYVGSSLGENLPRNFYEVNPNKEKLPNTFFIAPEKLELSKDDHPSQGSRGIFSSQGSESAELKPAHLLTPSFYNQNSGFREEELSTHQSNRTIIPVPKGFGTFAHEHNIQREESISPTPKRYETYVHLPPNAEPSIDDRFRKNKFTQSIERSSNDHGYPRQAKEDNPIVPGAMRYERPTAAAVTAQYKRESLDNNYYEVEEGSGAQLEDPYLDDADDGPAAQLPCEMRARHVHADQQPSEDNRENVPYYYHQEYYIR